MLIIAVCPLSVLATQYLGDVAHFGQMASVMAVAVICIGAAAHQAWSANLYTTVSDMFPRRPWLRHRIGTAAAAWAGDYPTAGGQTNRRLQ